MKSKKPSTEGHKINDDTFIIVEEMPAYKDGKDALDQYLLNECANSTIKGKVFVSFTVDQKGNVVDVGIAKSSNEKLNEKALSIVQNMDTWKPGKQRGKPVKVAFTVLLEF